jgi:hypothetical protein
MVSMRVAPGSLLDTHTFDPWDQQKNFVLFYLPRRKWFSLIPICLNSRPPRALCKLKLRTKIIRVNEVA